MKIDPQSYNNLKLSREEHLSIQGTGLPLNLGSFSSGTLFAIRTHLRWLCIKVGSTSPRTKGIVEAAGHTHTMRGLAGQVSARSVATKNTKTTHGGLVGVVEELVLSCLTSPGSDELQRRSRNMVAWMSRPRKVLKLVSKLSAPRSPEELVVLRREGDTQFTLVVIL